MMKSVVALAAVALVAANVAFCAAANAPRPRPAEPGESDAETGEEVPAAMPLDADGWRCEGDCSEAVACPFCNPPPKARKGRAAKAAKPAARGTRKRPPRRRDGGSALKSPAPDAGQGKSRVSGTTAPRRTRGKGGSLEGKKSTPSPAARVAGEGAAERGGGGRVSEDLTQRKVTRKRSKKVRTVDAADVPQNVPQNVPQSVTQTDGESAPAARRKCPRRTARVPPAARLVRLASR